MVKFSIYLNRHVFVMDIWTVSSRQACGATNFLHAIDIRTVYIRQACGAADFSTCNWYRDCVQRTRLWCCQCFYTFDIHSVYNWQDRGAAVFYICLLLGLCTTNKSVLLPVLTTFVWYRDCEQPKILWCCQFFYMCLISGLWTNKKTVMLPILLDVFDTLTVYNQQGCGAANYSTCVLYLDCVKPSRMWRC